MWFAAKLIGLDVGAGVWLIRKVDSKEVGLFSKLTDQDFVGI
jgi:hypothetical protein